MPLLLLINFYSIGRMISFLADVPYFLDQLAKLHGQEWGHLYPDWDFSKARSEFLGEKADGSLPATLVMHEGLELMGSVSVVFGDCPTRPEWDPWLASLYVVEAWRCRGYALELVHAASALAAATGVTRIFVFTESAENLFFQSGFEMLDRTELQGVPIRILTKSLSAPNL